MTSLTSSEMRQIQGGGSCGLLRVVTAASCWTGLMVACGIGLAGGAALC